MDIKLSNEVTFEPDWRKNIDLPPSERILITIKPLTQGDMIEFMDTGADRKANLALAQRLIPAYVLKLENLTLNSAPVTVDMLFEKPVFMGLVSEIINKLVEITMPNEEETKN